MQIVFRNSGNLKNGNLYGLSNLSAMILNEGTKSDGALEFASKLEQKAISLDVTNGNETFVFEINSLTDEFDSAIKLLSNLLQEPNYTQKSFDKIIQKTKGELAQKENDFDYVASLELKKLLFDNNQMSAPSLGTLETLNKIKLQDVIDFIDNNIVLNNAIVVIGGDISKEAYTGDGTLVNSSSEFLSINDLNVAKEL